MKFKLVAIPFDKERWKVLATFQAPNLEKARVIANTLANQNIIFERYCMEWKEKGEDEAEFRYARYDSFMNLLAWDR